MANAYQSVIDSMWPDERKRFENSYGASGAGRSQDDFLLDHAGLYQFAREDDPRHAGVYFGPSLEKLMADPNARAQVMARAAKLKSETPSLKGLRQVSQ